MKTKVRRVQESSAEIYIKMYLVKISLETHSYLTERLFKFLLTMLVILFLSKMTNIGRTLGLFPEKIICERWIAYLHPKKITPKNQCFETYHLQKK